MRYANLGRSGVKVSRLCLGTMNFGAQTSEGDSHAIMDKALESGINFFDTANGYGMPVKRGLTEEIIGRWLAKGGGRRESIVLATKVYGAMSDAVNDRGLSAFNIRQACENSLRRLQTDHIDLYQMHHIDRSAPIEETLQAMELLVSEGKVLYIGGSNFPAWHIAKFNMAARARNFLGLLSEQPLYNLMQRTVELEVLPAARDFGVGVIPWSPLASGVLGGVLKDESAGVRRKMPPEKLEKLRPQLKKWEAFCEKRGQEPGSVALAWLLANPAVTAPIIGPRTMRQFEDALKALDVELDEKALKKLDEIWPGPGGPAPEAYSW